MKPPPRFPLHPLVAAISVLTSITPLASSAVTDEQIAQVINDFKSIQAEQPGRFRMPPAPKSLESVDIESLNASQYLELCRHYLHGLAPKPLRERLRVTGDRIAQLTDTHGAEAATYAMDYLEAPDREAPDADWDAFRNTHEQAFMKALNHPGALQALSEGRCTALLLKLYFSENKEALIKDGVFQRISPTLTDSFPAEQVRHLLCFFRVICDMDTRLTAEDIERLRKLLVTKLEQRLKHKEVEQEKGESTYLGQQLLFAMGAKAKGMLIDHQAPAMDVLWAYPQGAPSSMAELKGKIVVIDFWATWCGPCVAAFPHMRELVKRYQGMPVEFVGITSLQGYVSNPQTRQRHKCADADEEFKQMAEWCQQMRVSWKVWITKQDCFNPDYGVYGIPHVAIIGSDGKVKVAGLSPHGPAIENVVDSQLKAMGLTPPQSPEAPSPGH